LAKYYTEDADLRELERRLLLVAHSISLSEFKGCKVVPVKNTRGFRQFETALDKFERRGSTFEADLEALKAQYYEKRSNLDKALIHANRALKTVKV